MNRRTIFAQALAGAVSVALAGPAFAVDLVGELVSELRSQGFTTIDVSRTMLGRVRIDASGGSGMREIVVNPNSGEILRDLWTSSGSKTSKSSLLARNTPGKKKDKLEVGDDLQADDVEGPEEDDDPASNEDNSGGEDSGGEDSGGEDSGGEDSGGDEDDNQ